MKYYFRCNDKYHRTDGPAFEFQSGSKVWYLNGKKHNLYGPAVERFTGELKWYIEDLEYDEKEFNNYILNLK